MVYVVNGGDNLEANVCDKKPCVWKEVLLSFLASLPFFTHGLETIELSASVHSGHFVYSNEEVPWNATALISAAIITAPIYCYAIDRYGRKVGLFIVSLVQGASCIPLFLPRNFTNIISFHIVAGISTGGLFTVLPTYIVETSSLKTQGFSLCLTLVMTTAGYLMKLAMDLEYMMYLLAAMVMVQLLSMLMLVESPAYFVKVGKLQEALESISTLKSLDTNNQNLADELSSLMEESKRAKSKGKLSIIGILKNAIYRDGTKIGIIMFTTMVLCGSIVFLDQDKTLEQLKMASDPDRTLVLGCLCAGSLLSLLFIWFLERRYLITLGYIIMVLSMGLLAVYTQLDLTVTSLRWLPVAALGALVFGYGIAWGLPYVIMVEFYNFEIRAKMISFLFIYAQILKLIHIHTFKYIEEYIGIYTIFYVFTFINLYGCVYCLFAIPDLRGKTNRQIERQLKRVPLLKFHTRTLVDNK